MKILINHSMTSNQSMAKLFTGFISWTNISLYQKYLSFLKCSLNLTNMTSVVFLQHYMTFTTLYLTISILIWHKLLQSIL